MTKANQNNSKPTAVTIEVGPLAGMTFSVEDHTPVEKGEMRVKYMAPNNGPRAVVTHRQVRGEFREADRREAVRIAFSSLLPANIAWSKESGYSDRISGAALAWDHNLARFVTQPTKTETKKSEKPGNKQTGDANTDDLR